MDNIFPKWLEFSIFFPDIYNYIFSYKLKEKNTSINIEREKLKMD